MKLVKCGVLGLVALLLFSGCAADKATAPRPEAAGKTLVVCSSLEDAVTKNLVQQFATQTGITVEVVYLPPGLITERLQFLAAHTYDMWLGGATEEYYLAEKRNLLRSYQPPAAVALPPQFTDRDWRWTPLYADYIAFICNSQRLDSLDLDAPASWDDLLQPVFYRELVLAKPENGGASYGMITGLWQLRGERAALDYAGRLRTQAPLYVGSEAEAAELVYAGKKLVAVLPWEYARRLEKEHRHLEAVPVQKGNKYLVTAAAVLKTGTNEKGAQLFLDYLLSPAAQEIFTAAGHTPLLQADHAAAQAGHVALGPLPHTDLGWTAREKDAILKAWRNAY